MNTVSLSTSQLKLEQKVFWRNPTSAFFTFLFPILMLVIFGAIFGRGSGSGADAYKTYLVPGMITMAIVSGTWSNLAISICIQRDELLLKRLRGTPLPATALFAGKILNCIVTVAISIVIMIAIGRLLFGVALPVNWVTFLIYLLYGILTFSILGIAFTAVISNANAAPAIVQLPYMVILFISGVFFPLWQLPNWLVYIANVFPVRWLAEGLRAGYLGEDYIGCKKLANGNCTPRSVHGLESLTSVWPALVVLGIWFVVGLVLALRYFRWEKRTG